MRWGGGGRRARQGAEPAAAGRGVGGVGQLSGLRSRNPSTPGAGGEGGGGLSLTLPRTALTKPLVLLLHFFRGGGWASLSLGPGGGWRGAGFIGRWKGRAGGLPPSTAHADPDVKKILLETDLWIQIQIGSIFRTFVDPDAYSE